MKSLPEFFGCTFLINLPDRTDRLKAAKRQFSRVNWSFGANGVQIFRAFRYSDSMGFPSAAVRGCFQSHLECLKRAHEHGSHSVMILEDDIALSSCLKRMTPSIEAVLTGRDWDFIYFGHYETGRYSRCQ